MQPLTIHRVGDITVTRIPELVLKRADVPILFPHTDPAPLVASAGHWDETLFDHSQQHLRQSIHSWLVKTPAHTVLIDTSAGNNKERPDAPLFHHLHQPFMAYLNAAGVTPEQIDLVLMTHIHADHVGRNTCLHDGQWLPTFPNARYVFSKREFEYNAALSASDTAQVRTLIDAAGLGAPAHPPLGGVFEDSIASIVAAGLDDPITANDTIAGFTFHSTPGHSIDHTSISVTSQGETAFFWGDVMHHPLQTHHLDVNSRYCEFPAAAVTARRNAVRFALDHHATVFTTHFGGSGAGRLTQEAGQLDWQFKQGDAV